MALKFVLVERIEETYEHERDDVWSDKCGLGDEDRAQLLSLVLSPLDPKLTDERLQTAKARDLFAGALEGFDDYPLEAWDLVDEEEEPVYRLWLFHGNRGLLLETESQKPLGEIHACILRADYDNIDYHDAEELRVVLQTAQRRA